MKHGHSSRAVQAIAAVALAVLAILAQPADAEPALHACDIYASAGRPCVAAHSTTRALFAQYNGPLYAVKRASDGQSTNIGLLAPGDYANAAAQDAFCTGTTCIITKIYDQSSYHNDLTIEGPGGRTGTGQDVGAQADALPVTAGGHQVYGISFSTHMGYRNDHTSGVAKNGKPETMYMVTSGTHANSGCCFDYGNAETSNDDTGAGHMDTLNFSTACDQAGVDRPRVKADMENGLYTSDEGCKHNPHDQPQIEPYVTALLKNNGQTYFSLKYGDAQSGPLTTAYAGPEPKPVPSGSYSPMHQEGAIVLGTGGDDSNFDIGSFFEGVMTAGVSPDYADALVQADIVNVGYGGPTGMAGALTLGDRISLMTSEPNASAYISHHGRQNSDSTPRAVIEAVQPWSEADRRQSATWVVRRGFAKAGCLSFEALDRPGAFLRHAGADLVVANVDGTAAFPGDSTFCPVAGLDGRGNSFQSADVAGAYIRRDGRKVFIATDGGSQPYDKKQAFQTDVSFVVTQPLAR